jgi:hypothetical protein
MSYDAAATHNDASARLSDAQIDELFEMGAVLIDRRSEHYPEGGYPQAGDVRIKRPGQPDETRPPYTQKELRRVRQNDQRTAVPSNDPMEVWARDGFVARGPKRTKEQSDRERTAPDEMGLWDALLQPARDDRPGWRSYCPVSAEIPDDLQSIVALMDPDSDRGGGIRPSVMKQFHEMSPAERGRRASMTDEEQELEATLDIVRNRTWGEDEDEPEPKSIMVFDQEQFVRGSVDHLIFRGAPTPAPPPVCRPVRDDWASRKPYLA